MFDISKLLNKKLVYVIHYTDESSLMEKPLFVVASLIVSFIFILIEVKDPVLSYLKNTFPRPLCTIDETSGILETTLIS